MQQWFDAEQIYQKIIEENPSNAVSTPIALTIFAPIKALNSFLHADCKKASYYNSQIKWRYTKGIRRGID